MRPCRCFGFSVNCRCVINSIMYSYKCNLNNIQK